MNHQLGPGVISDSQRVLYKAVVQRAAARKLTFAVGGSLAMGFYSGLARCSKDLDLYVTPEAREAMMGVLDDTGFVDYFDTLGYDRGWIYRGTRDDEIVDIIWSMANRRSVVDDEWLNRGPTVNFDGAVLRLIPLEEMIWSKLYVLQRDRCDWPDVLNLIDAAGRRVDWRRLLARLGEDIPLLAAVLSVYRWLRPDRRCLPDWLWQEVAAFPVHQTAETVDTRAALLDSRQWLLALAPPEVSRC